jgi:HemY protein
MRWIVGFVSAFALAVAVSLFLRFNHGNVAILWPPYRIDVSVNFALATLVLGFGVVHAALIALARALDLPQRVRQYQERRVRDHSLLALRDAVLAYLEGRLSRVERAAQRAAHHPLCGAPAALLAARAAQRLQEYERRDEWLRRAEQDVQAAPAAWMTQAELAVEDHRADEALTWLERVHGRGARHMMSLRLALRAFEQAHHWDEVLRTLRVVEKRHALHPAAVRRLRIKACTELVARLRGDAVGLRTFWRGLRADERAVPEVTAEVAAALIMVDEHSEARRLLEDALDASFDPLLVTWYARLTVPSVRERLERLEAWRQRYGDHPVLFLALGQVCMTEKIWGKAEDFLRAAVASEPSVAAYAALGELLDLLDRPVEAAAQFRQAVYSAHFQTLRRLDAAGPIGGEAREGRGGG